MSRYGKPLLLALLVAWTGAFAWMSFAFQSDQLDDFSSFVRSAHHAAAGRDPYTAGGVVNLNPPISALLFQPLTWAESDISRTIWLFLSVSLYGLSIGMLARAYRQHVSPERLVWTGCLTGLWLTLQQGQLYVALLALTTGAWLSLRHDRWLPAGLCLGLLAALKPPFLVWPALLFLAGAWPVALTAGAVTIVLTLIPLLWYDPGIYVRWLTASQEMVAMLLLNNGSLPGIAASHGLGWLGALLSALLLGGLAIWAWHDRPNLLTVSSAALVAALLASPLTWSGYTLVLLPVLMSRRWSRLWWGVAGLLSTLALVVQALLAQIGWAHVTLGPIILASLLLAALALLRDSRHPTWARTTDAVTGRGASPMPTS